MTYLLLNGDRCAFFQLTKNNSEVVFVPNDPNNTDYQRIKEHYDAIEGEKPFVWPN